MAKIYVASSWRNKYQPEVVAALRKAGHKVYDFRNPKDNPGGFHDHLQEETGGLEAPERVSEPLSRPTVKQRTARNPNTPPQPRRLYTPHTE